MASSGSENLNPDIATAIGRQADLHVEVTSRLLEALSESENKLRRRVEFLSQVVFELDDAGMLDYVSPAWLHVMGEDPMRSLRLPFRNFLREGYRQTFDEFFADTSRARHTFQAKAQRWESSWAKISIARVPDGGFVGAIEDLSSEQQAQGEIEMLSLVASATDNMVIITDARGHTTWVNNAFTRRTGYTLDDMEGKTPGSVLQREETSRDVTRVLGTAIREHRSARAEILTETGFRAAAFAVNVGGVPEGDAQIERLVYHRARSVGVDAQSEVVAAEAEGRNCDAGVADGALFHCLLSTTFNRV